MAKSRKNKENTVKIPRTKPVIRQGKQPQKIIIFLTLALATFVGIRLFGGAFASSYTIEVNASLLDGSSTESSHAVDNGTYKPCLYLADESPDRRISVITITLDGGSGLTTHQLQLGEAYKNGSAAYCAPPLSVRSGQIYYRVQTDSGAVRLDRLTLDKN